MNEYKVICNIFLIIVIVIGISYFDLVAIAVLIMNSVKPIYTIYSQYKFKKNVKNAIKQKQFQQQSKS